MAFFFFWQIFRLQITISIFNINIRFGHVLWQITWVTDSGLPEDILKLQINACGIFYTWEKCFRKEWQMMNAAFLGRRTRREQARCLVIRVLCPVSCPQWWDTSVCASTDEPGRRGGAQPSVAAAGSLARKMVLETLVSATEPYAGCLGKLPEITRR